MAGDQGVTVEGRGCKAAAARRASAACLQVRKHTVKNVLGVKSIGRRAVVRAELHAAGLSAFSDGDPRRKIDHIEGVHIACGIKDRRRQVPCVDLGQQLRLDLRIVNGRAVIGH